MEQTLPPFAVMLLLLFAVAAIMLLSLPLQFKTASVESHELS